MGYTNLLAYLAHIQVFVCFSIVYACGSTSHDVDSGPYAEER